MAGLASRCMIVRKSRGRYQTWEAVAKPTEEKAQAKGRQGLVT